MNPGLLIHAAWCGVYLGQFIHIGAWWAVLLALLWWYVGHRAFVWAFAQEPRWRAWVNRKFEENE